MLVAGTCFLILAVGGYVAATRVELTDLQATTLRLTVVISIVGSLASIVALVPWLRVEAVGVKAVIVAGFLAAGAASYASYPARRAENADGRTSSLRVVDGVVTGSGEALATSVDSDCFHTQAPNIGNEAVKQCLGQERRILSAAKNGRLLISVDSRGIITGIGDARTGEPLGPDLVTKGPAAWPDVGKPAIPPRSSVTLQPCLPTTDPGERCMP
jgi:hypothetical protein